LIAHHQWHDAVCLTVALRQVVIHCLLHHPATLNSQAPPACIEFLALEEDRICPISVEALSGLPPLAAELSDRVSGAIAK